MGDFDYGLQARRAGFVVSVRRGPSAPVGGTFRLDHALPGESAGPRGDWVTFVRRQVLDQLGAAGMMDGASTMSRAVARVIAFGR